MRAISGGSFLAATERQAAIVEFLLREADFVSARHLANQFDVAVSTIERDLSTLRSSGFSISAQPGRSGGVRLEVLSSEPRTFDEVPKTAGRFVGRRRELSSLAKVLDSTQDSGSIVLIAGGSGIGKSRLVGEFRRLCESAGSLVLWNRSLENFRTPPLWPWISIVESSVKDAPANIAEEAAGLIAEMTAPGGSRSTPGDQTDSMVRFRLFDRLSRYLTNLLTKHVVIVLDDLQWTDASSLAFLEFFEAAIHESPVLLIGMYDSTTVTRRSPLGRALGRLSRSENLLRISLGPLSESDAQRMIDMESSSSLSTDLKRGIVERSEGNPFFIREIVQYVSEVAFHDAQAERSLVPLNEIPEGIRDALGRRLNLLSESCNDLLGYAAIIGREFSADYLDAVVEESRVVLANEVFGLLDEATGAGIVARVDGTNLYRFTHALVHLTFIDEIAPGDQSRIHATVGQVLERIYGEHASSNSEDLARHFLAAVPRVGAGPAVRYSMIAGKQALAKFAYEDAATHFNNILDLRWDLLDEDVRFEAIGRLGQATAAYLPRSEKHGAVSTLTKAVKYFVSTEQIARAAEFAVTDVVPISSDEQFVEGTKIGEMIEFAIDLVPQDSKLHARLLAKYSLALVSERSDVAGSRRAAERALQIATVREDPFIKLLADRALLSLSFRDGSDQDAFIKSARMTIRDALRIGDIESELRARWYLLSTLMAFGGLGEAETVGAEFLERAEFFNETSNLQQALGMNANLAVRFGRWERARELAENSNRRFGGSFWSTTPRRNIDFATGDKSTVDGIMDSVIKQSATPGFTRVPAVISLFCNLPERIDSRLIEVAVALVSEASPTPQNSQEELAVRFLSGLTAAFSDNRTIVESSYQLLRGEQKPVLQATGIHPERIMAKLAEALGEPTAAVAHLTRAIEYYEENGCRPELAISLVELVGFRSGLGAPVEDMRNSLDRAGTIASGLGMTALVVRVDAAKSDLHQARHSHPDGLTDREAEVLLLIAGGSTNRIIGEQLFISENTVTRHITNIYSKIGVVNRAEATAYVFQTGLAEK